MVTDGLLAEIWWECENTRYSGSLWLLIVKLSQLFFYYRAGLYKLKVQIKNKWMMDSSQFKRNHVEGLQKYFDPLAGLHNSFWLVICIWCGQKITLLEDFCLFGLFPSDKFFLNALLIKWAQASPEPKLFQRMQVWIFVNVGIKSFLTYYFGLEIPIWVGMVWVRLGNPMACRWGLVMGMDDAR